MKKSIFFFCFLFKLVFGFAQANLPVYLGNGFTIRDNSSLTGMNMAMIWPYISGDFQNGQYQNCQLSEPIMSKIKEWNLRNFRFPGGTVANYYHFNGKFGYGSDSLEFVCSPNYYFNYDMKNRFKSDKFFNCNFIYPFADAMVKLKNEGKTVELNYVVNLFTHINHKHLNKYNKTIDTLFNKYDSIYGNLKTKKLKFMDSSEIQILEGIFNRMVLDTRFAEIKNKIVLDSAFKYYLDENLDAIRYLVSRNITIKRIELGNEFYAETLLFDDDLSEVGRDCTDTVGESFDKGDYFGINLIEGLYKYHILCDIYMSKIRDIGNVDFGIVSGPSNASIVFENSKWKIKDQFGSSSKLNYFWNNCANRISSKAVIDHAYAQTAFSCSDIQGNNIDLLYNNAKEIYNFYTDSLYFYDLRKVKSEFPNKDVWGTEWNIGKPEMVANTLLQVGFICDQLGNLTKANSLNEFNLRNAVYHLLASQSINNFSLIRTGYYAGTEYKDTLQLLHFAFDIWKEVLNNKYKYLNITKNNLFKINPQLTKEVRTYSFYNATDRKFTFLYTNYGNTGVKFVPSDIDFILNSVNQSVVKKEIKYMNGENLYSSDRNCDDEKKQDGINDIQYYINDFQLVNTDSITIPRYSVGVVNVYLSNSTGLDNQNKINAKIYPNPANDILFIDLDEPSNNLDIRIIDVLGKLVYAEPFGDFRKTSIPTNSLNGVYFLSIVDENGNIKHAQKIEIF